MVYKNSLHPRALDESSLSIGRVKTYCRYTWNAPNPRLLLGQIKTLENTLPSSGDPMHI